MQMKLVCSDDSFTYYRMLAVLQTYCAALCSLSVLPYSTL